MWTPTILNSRHGFFFTASHSDDGVTDPRLMIAPATEHVAGEMRNIYFDTEGYPRYIGYDRGPGYYPQPGQQASVPIGAIPQMVGRTFALFEGTYAVMNEKHVAIAESTCSGFVAFASFLTFKLPSISL